MFVHNVDMCITNPFANKINLKLFKSKNEHYTLLQFHNSCMQVRAEDNTLMVGHKPFTQYVVP